MINSQENDKVLAFNKYANFLSDKFGISVVFDGTNAHTDGKTITLPNISGMSEEEIDFLYCVLLHEIGHIRYSDFSKEAFREIRSENHFVIANAIEDARIENLLMKEFDGAHDVFDKLYNFYVLNDKFMNRVFGFSGKSSDELMSLCTYVHDKILEINIKSSKEKLFGKATLKKTSSFVKENNIDEILKTITLDSWKDVISLSNFLYDLFYSSKKDRSNKNTLEEREDTILSAVESISSGLSKEVEFHEKLSTLKSELKEKHDELERLRKSSFDKLSSLDNHLNESNKKIQEINDQIDKIDLIESTSKKIESLKKSILKKETKNKELQERIEKYQKNDKIEKEKLDEKIAKISEAIRSNNSIIEKKKLALIDQANIASKIDMNQDLKGKTVDQFESELSSEEEKFDELLAKIYEIRNPISSVEDCIKSINDKIKEEKIKLNKDLIKQIVDVQEKLSDCGIKIESIPKGAESAWGEDGDAQKDFDKNASLSEGTIVINGKSFSKTASRDIRCLLEKTKVELKEIDLAKIFKKENCVNRFGIDSFSEVKGSGEESVEPSFSRRKHVPIHTGFDIIKSNSTSNGKEIEEIRKKRAEALKKARSVISHKLKYKKKNKYNPNKEDGQLDQRSLWKLAAKTENNFFEVPIVKYSNDVASSIVVDISGSMESDPDRLNIIKELSLLLSDGLKFSHVKHEIIGYHAPINEDLKKMNGSPISYNRLYNNLETVVYKSFNDQKNNGIQNIEIKCSDNSDGESLRIAGKRLKKERSKRKIIFLISDCRPYLSGSDTSVLDQDLRESISTLKKDKIEVIVFSFDDFGKDFFGENLCVVSKIEDAVDFLGKKL